MDMEGSTLRLNSSGKDCGSNAPLKSPVKEGHANNKKAIRYIAGTAAMTELRFGVVAGSVSDPEI